MTRGLGSGSRINPVSSPDFFGMATKSLTRDKLRQNDIFYFFTSSESFGGGTKGLNPRGALTLISASKQ